VHLDARLKRRRGGSPAAAAERSTPKEDCNVGEVVLIADDEEDIIRFVEINLRLEGLEVITAQDGEEALQKAFNQRPSLILLDAMMPRMDGYEVCAKLRADERTFQTPIIMLTAKSLEADRALARDVGADDCIIKPFDPTELVDRVKSRLAGATGGPRTDPWPGWGGDDPWPGGGMGKPGAGGGDPWPGGSQDAGSWSDRGTGAPGTGAGEDPWPDEDERDPWSSGGRWPTR
jgi:CheY-like chemotaxis protein